MSSAVLFSDIDGTLAHYMDKLPASKPASGYISSATCSLQLDQFSTSAQGLVSKLRGTYTCTLTQVLASPANLHVWQERACAQSALRSSFQYAHCPAVLEACRRGSLGLCFDAI